MVHEIEMLFDAVPKYSTFTLALNNGVSHLNSILTGATFYNNLSHEETIEGIDVDTTNKIHLYINHDPASSLSQISVELHITHNPITIYS